MHEERSFLASYEALYGKKMNTSETIKRIRVKQSIEAPIKNFVEEKIDRYLEVVIGDVSSMRDPQPRLRGKGMKDEGKKGKDELRPEYDLDYSKAVRGKYCRRLMEQGSNVVVLDPDVAEAFHDSASVNEALRSLLNLTRSTQRLTNRSSERA